MATFVAFLRAVFAHGEPVLGGLLVSGVIKLADWYFSRRSRQIPWQAYGVILTACLFLACFFAWRDEYFAHQELAAVRPDFRLEIVRQVFGDIGKNTLSIQVIAGIKNIGKMQSVAGGWHLSFTDPTGKPLPVEQVYFPGNVTLEHKDGRKEILGDADLIDRKTVTEPVEVGMYVQGLLYGTIKGMQPEDLKPGYTVTIRCKDVFDVPYTASFTIPQNLPPYEHRRPPGLDTQRFK